MILLSPEIYRMTNNFINMCKRIPKFVLDPSRNIFITYPKPDGSVSQLSTSQVNKSIQRLWNLGLSHRTKHISATRLRKATSTAVRVAHPEARTMLAKYMTHSPNTADRYYNLYNQREMATPVVKLIASVMEKPAPENEEKSVHWPKDSEEPETNNTNDSTNGSDDRNQAFTYVVRTIIQSRIGTTLTM